MKKSFSKIGDMLIHMLIDDREKIGAKCMTLNIGKPGVYKEGAKKTKGNKKSAEAPGSG